MAKEKTNSNTLNLKRTFHFLIFRVPGKVCSQPPKTFQMTVLVEFKLMSGEGKQGNHTPFPKYQIFPVIQYKVTTKSWQSKILQITLQRFDRFFVSLNHKDRHILTHTPRSKNHEHCNVVHYGEQIWAKILQECVQPQGCPLAAWDTKDLHKGCSSKRLDHSGSSEKELLAVLSCLASLTNSFHFNSSVHLKSLGSWKHLIFHIKIPWLELINNVQNSFFLIESKVLWHALCYCKNRISQ